MLWHEQSWPTIQSLDKETPVVIPLGSLEQHGRHLPLFVDSIQVTTIAERVEQVLHDQILLTPTLWLGSSHHHKDFPGTISARPSLYSKIIITIAISILQAGFRRLLFLNGHGGNEVPVAQALAELAAQDDDANNAYLTYSSWWAVGGEGIKPDKHDLTTPFVSHACEYETSTAGTGAFGPHPAGRAAAPCQPMAPHRIRWRCGYVQALPESGGWRPHGQSTKRYRRKRRRHDPRCRRRDRCLPQGFQNVATPGQDWPEMKTTITRITATQVVVPAKDGYVDRSGFGPSIFDKAPKWIIEIHTDDGLIGYGETPRDIGLGEVQWAAQQVIGKPLREIPWAMPIPPNLADNDMFGHFNPPVPHRLYEQDLSMSWGSMGVGMALQDLIAKAAGIRLCDLFGGAYHERVATAWWMGRSDPEHAARQMAIGLDLGYNSIKIKAAGEDDVVGIVAAIKKVGGAQTFIVVDPNGRFYRCWEAVRIAHRLEDAGFDDVIFEDPFPFDIDEWQLFRNKTSVPLACHGAAAPQVALANRSCDYINLSYPAHRFQGDAYMAARFGVLCWGASGVDLGILDTYLLHCSAAARVCVLPGDAVGHDIRVDDLIQEKLEVRDGTIKLPEGPGLGVTLDHEALAKFAKQTWESHSGSSAT